MAGFKRYARPPPIAPVGDAIAQLIDPELAGGTSAQMQDQDYYMDDSQFMGGNLPPIDYYGQPKQQWNAEMMDRLLKTDIDRFDKEGNMLPRPKLWLFDTEAYRHLQLTNLRSRDQTEIERDIADILMLSHQDGNESLCDEQQYKTYSKLLMFKSRSDLPIQHRERDAWFTTVSEMKSPEIKRPQGSGGFFSDLFGKKKRNEY